MRHHLFEDDRAATVADDNPEEALRHDRQGCARQVLVVICHPISPVCSRQQARHVRTFTPIRRWRPEYLLLRSPINAELPAAWKGYRMI